jgi:hypothetical protein
MSQSKSPFVDKNDCDHGSVEVFWETVRRFERELFLVMMLYVGKNCAP